ncbi:hypothetical protein CANDROIZ_150008 [Candidatus Roizmanbacteria bacterium]|nr:hypothetical protein CANDROIZ_150008 [Candidatus Roizmanbacteria bacterium]
MGILWAHGKHGEFEHEPNLKSSFLSETNNSIQIGLF